MKLISIIQLNNIKVNIKFMDFKVHMLFAQISKYIQLNVINSNFLLNDYYR